MCKEELRDLYSSPSITRIIKLRRMRWAGHVAQMWEKRNTYRLLVGKPEGKRPQGRPRHRWVDNIRIDLGEMGWGDVDWIGLGSGYEQVESSCEFGIDPSGSKPVQASYRSLFHNVILSFPITIGMQC
jgi:hypothetical protein